MGEQSLHWESSEAEKLVGFETADDVYDKVKKKVNLLTDVLNMVRVYLANTFSNTSDVLTVLH